jgi:GST-like protein
VDTRKGEQFTPAFLAINPNAKTPALTDGEAVVFDSSAIMLYLAEKTGQFLSDGTPVGRAQLLSWLMFLASGIGPYSGQAVHFKHFAPEPKDYPVNRYLFEAERHWGILDAHLAKSPYMVGDAYTIVDMSVWGWARAVQFIFGPDAWPTYPHVKRLVDEINARPAAERAAALATRHVFKAEMDDEARGHMFPQNKRLAAA